MRGKITDKIASQLKPGQQVFDSQVPGFGLRCQGQTKTWFLRYRSPDKRQKLVTIGRLGEQWTPARARDEALRLRALHVTGEDPARTRSEFKQSPTVRQLAEQYMATHGQRKRTASEDQRRLDRHVIPALGDLRVASVTVPDVERLHQSLAHAPYEANRVLALVHTMFGKALRWGWRKDNPAAMVERFHEDRRERYLSPEEVARLNQVLDAYPNRPAANALRFILLTGCRKSEALKATWGQFDLDAGTWTKPSSHTKQNRVHRVPLSPPATALLRAMPHDNGFVFCGHRGAPLRDLKHVWEDIRGQAGIADCRMHDLRHSFASALVSAGVSLPVIGGLLGHTQPATTARYSHLQDEALRVAAGLAASKLS
jgi:integrase